MSPPKSPGFGLDPKMPDLVLDGTHLLYLIIFSDETRAGYILSHQIGPDEWCSGTIWTSPQNGRPLWKVLRENPLTLTPSVLCRCGHHGWIRGGAWHPA